MSMKPEASLEILLEQILQSEQSGDMLGKAAACTKAGQVYLTRNHYSEAAHYYQEAIRIYAREGQTDLQARSLNHLGVCLIMSGQAKQALECLDLAQDALGPEPDAALNAAIQGNRGLAFSALQDYNHAFQAHKAVMEAAERLGDDHLRLSALINLADISLQDKDYRPAQGFALVALDLAQELQPHPGLMIIYDLLGMISSRLGDLRSAVEFHQQAYLAACEAGDLLRQGIALANQGLALEGLTELEQAAVLLDKAQEIFSLLHSTYREKTAHDLQRIRNSLAPRAGREQ
ncbi:MAG: tetratricopeptide repeat protein [Anaerolineales bacterium]